MYFERPSHTYVSAPSDLVSGTLKKFRRSFVFFFGIPAGPPRGPPHSRDATGKRSVTQVYIYMSCHSARTPYQRIDQIHPLLARLCAFSLASTKRSSLSGPSLPLNHNAIAHREFNQRVTSRPLAWMLPAPKDVALLRLRRSCAVSRGGGHISSRLLSAILLSHTSRSVSLSRCRSLLMKKHIAPGTTTSADLPRSPVTHANSLPWQSTAHACCTCQSDALSLEPALNV